MRERSEAASEHEEKTASPADAPGSTRVKRIVLWCLAIGLGCALMGVIGLGSIFWYYGRDIDEIDEAALRNYQPPQVTRVYARDGELIGEIFTERRTVVAVDEIPPHVEEAFLAAEDADFYRHRGMDFMGMARALVTNVRAGRIKQGASTITQQVVKNFLLSPERSFERKVQELILARRLEQVLSKKEILGLYLNSIYLGHGRYGIEEASQYYFGKSVREIDIGQAALLATLPKAPGRDSPYQNPEKAKTRQRFVLQQMVEKNFADVADIEPFLEAELEVQPRENAGQIERGAEEFVDAAREALEERYGAERVRTLGARVVTTVDLELQREAREGLMKGLQAVDARRRFGHGIKPAREANLKRAFDKGAGPHELGAVYPIVIEACPEAVLAARPEGGKGEGAGFCGKIGEAAYFVSVPAGSRYDEDKKTHDKQFPAGGITMARVLVRPEQEGAPHEGWGLAEIGSGPEAAVVLTAVESGEVLAMIGGSAYQRAGFNRVLRAKRQPGSSFKPMVYGAALASRRFTAATLVEDSPEIYEKWRPTNFERDVYRGQIRVRTALTHSVNTVAIKLLDAVGFEAVHAFAKSAGIDAPLADNLSLALGTSEVTPFELMRAYLTLARGGSRIEPTFISSVEIAGEENWSPSRETTPAIEPGVAYVMTSMMRSVVEEGTAKRAKALKRPAAGKTGTSGDNKDAWFAGFTPDFVAVAWVGFDVPAKLGSSETGGRAALPIWLAVMQAASKELPVRDFSPPPEVSVRRIDKATGLLAPQSTWAPDGSEVPVDPATVMEESFIAGTEPVEVADPLRVGNADAVLDLYGDGPSGADDAAFLDGDEVLGADKLDSGNDEARLEGNDPLRDRAGADGGPAKLPDLGGSAPDAQLDALPSLDDEP